MSISLANEGTLPNTIKTSCFLLERAIYLCLANLRIHLQSSILALGNQHHYLSRDGVK